MNFDVILIEFSLKKLILEFISAEISIDQPFKNLVFNKNSFFCERDESKRINNGEIPDFSHVSSNKMLRIFLRPYP